MGGKPGMDFRAGKQNARIFRRDGWQCVFCGYDPVREGVSSWYSTTLIHEPKQMTTSMKSTIAKR